MGEGDKKNAWYINSKSDKFPATLLLLNFQLWLIFCHAINVNQWDFTRNSCGKLDMQKSLCAFVHGCIPLWKIIWRYKDRATEDHSLQVENLLYTSISISVLQGFMFEIALEVIRVTYQKGRLFFLQKTSFVLRPIRKNSDSENIRK